MAATLPWPDELVDLVVLRSSADRPSWPGWRWAL